jgi:hypothetical protein
MAYDRIPEPDFYGAMLVRDDEPKSKIKKVAPSVKGVGENEETGQSSDPKNKNK